MSSSVCTLSAGGEILAELERPPGLRAQQADPQIRADELAAERLQLVAGEAVDAVDAEMLAPVPDRSGGTNRLMMKTIGKI